VKKVIPDKVEAQSSKGVLIIKLPKEKEQEEVKSLPVKVKVN